MKAMLIIDMPDKCNRCPLYITPQYCGVEFYNHKEVSKYGANKPDWCPLSHPLKRVGHDYYFYDRKYLLDNLDREIEMLKKVKEYESNISN